MFGDDANSYNSLIRLGYHKFTYVRCLLITLWIFCKYLLRSPQIGQTNNFFIDFKGTLSQILNLSVSLKQMPSIPKIKYKCQLFLNTFEGDQ